LVPLFEYRRDDVNAGMLAADVCIYGLYAGVQVPSQATDVDLPQACVGAPELLRFYPEGTVEWVGQDLAGSGVTLTIADRRSTEIRFAFVEVFPGGMIRRFDEVRAP
jgi:hypothetical protein